jgi:hypothetical protein
VRRTAEPAAVTCSFCCVNQRPAVIDVEAARFQSLGHALCADLRVKHSKQNHRQAYHDSGKPLAPSTSAGEFSAQRLPIGDVGTLAEEWRHDGQRPSRSRVVCSD